jgi:hypothetical protein
MKSLSFKRKGSAIRVMPDAASKKPYNWDRMVYFIFLVLVFGFLITWGIRKIFYIEAYGQVMYQNVDVRILNDCRVMKYYVLEDDTVHEGDTLFMYLRHTNKDGSSFTADLDGSVSNNQYDWVVREIYALRKTIAVNNTDLSKKQKEIKTIEAEIPAMKNQVTLDAMPLARLDVRQNELNQLRAEAERIQSENNELTNLINSLKPMIPANPQNKKGNATATGNDDMNESGEIGYYVSPIEGAINRIYTKPFETALKSEVIMSIHKNSPIYVKAFFNQEDMKYCNMGDEVNLEFPDGTTSKGIIRRFYYSTIPLPEEFQKRYEPTQRSIAADVYPVDSTAQKNWRTFYKMSVAIKRFKF